jgi:hypothetical protein
LDYSHLLSQVEVKIKTEPPDYEDNLELSGWIELAAMSTAELPAPYIYNRNTKTFIQTKCWSNTEPAQV